METSLREVATRWYTVVVDGAVRRRNRKGIWRTAEPQNTQTCEEVEPFAEVQRAPVASPGPVHGPVLWLALRRHPLKLIVWVNPRRHLL